MQGVGGGGMKPAFFGFNRRTAKKGANWLLVLLLRQSGLKSLDGWRSSGLQQHEVKLRVASCRSLVIDCFLSFILIALLGMALLPSHVDHVEIKLYQDINNLWELTAEISHRLVGKHQTPAELVLAALLASQAAAIKSTQPLLWCFDTFSFAFSHFMQTRTQHPFLEILFFSRREKKISALTLAGEEARINHFSISLQRFAYSLHSWIVQNQ